MTESQQPSRRRTWAVFLIIVVLLIVIWIIFTSSNDTATSADITPTPKFIATVLSPAPIPVTTTDLTVLFQDSFDETAGAWALSPGEQASYVNGVMFLEDSEITGDAWSRPHLRFQDFVLDVHSRWLGGSVGGTYGIRFRLSESGEYLGFYLHNDGWFTIVQNDEAGQTTLYEAYSSALSPAGESNHIHIEANGQSFRFFVNNRYLVDVQVAAPEVGDIMFVAQKVEGTESFRVGFDNLLVTLYPAQ